MRFVTKVDELKQVERNETIRPVKLKANTNFTSLTRFGVMFMMFSIYNSIIEKQRPLVMGILNVTPDSFFEAGKSFFAESAFNRALQIESDGADIIDIGGCSTSPGKTVLRRDSSSS